jgi:Icc-related predicted phosphoesterase
MNAYELAKAQQAYSAPTLEEIIKQQADRIAELEKQGEPVAWWTGKYEDEGEDFMFPNTRQAHIDHPQSETHKFFSIPLYTTPQTKPLSDDEVIKIRQTTKAKSTENWADTLAFARAIEERRD